jgi:hypothetical protein
VQVIKKIKAFNWRIEADKTHLVSKNARFIINFIINHLHGILILQMKMNNNQTKHFDAFRNVPKLLNKNTQCLLEHK